MDRLIELNKAHLILRPHKKNVNTFRQHIPFVVNFFQTRKNVFYSITEEYGDINEDDGLHLDIIIFTTGRIDNLLNKKFRKDEMDYVKKNLCSTIMNEKTGRPYYCLENENKKKEKNYNTKFLIGYNFKEYYDDSKICNKNYNNFDLDKNIIDDCIEFYNNNKQEKAILQKDEITLSPKNATYELLKWIKNKKPDVIDDNIIINTIKDKFCWIQLSKYHRQQLLYQLRVMCDMGDEYDEEQLKNTMIKPTNDYEDAYNSVYKCKNYDSITRYKHLYEKELLSAKEVNALIDFRLEDVSYADKVMLYVKE